VSDFQTEPSDILARLAALRELDAPTHGGHVLSYVYDSGMAELDELAAAALRMVQPVNGLDPTTFPSVAVLEREVVGFVRGILHGDENVVGSVTTGGTESCLLAVKTARDNWRHRGGSGQPRLLAPVTVHAAFQKAAHYFGLELDLVPVDPETGAATATDLVSRFGDDVALVVVSAPSYPFAGLDPVAGVAAAALDAGIDCHVDACIGGLVLPFWSDLPEWDFAVEGVTSISADLHKFGYAPKGASVLLHRGRDRQRTQYFATTRWPGYPVINPTILGSKSAGSLAASWAIIQALGVDGFADLAASCERSTAALAATIAEIEGLRIVGSPVGPLLAVTTDETVPIDRRIDPHHWADQARSHGWLLQLQPSIEQADGTRLPRTTHLTITPVTERVLPELTAALVAAASEVRGVAPVAPADVLGSLPPLGTDALDSESAFGLLTAMGLGAGGGLPERMAPLLALMEGLPAPISERLLTELLARLVEPASTAW
jgi:sphinganine-1-phosphate aldolase